MRRFFLCALAVTTFLASPAMAQNFGAPSPAAQPNFDQYPSFIEMTAQLQDGTQVDLRCGYMAQGTNIAADPGYMEMSVLGSGSYMRYQRIDNKQVVTVPAANTQGRFMLEVVDPNGLIVAKNCAVNGANDTVQNCTPLQPFMPAAQVASQDVNAANQCGTFFAKSNGKINPATYNSLKTDIFKNALRQKVAVLEAP